MKKISLLIASLLFIVITHAHNNNDTSSHFYYRLFPMKATIYYKGDSIYTGMLTEISDSIIALFPISSDKNRASRIIIPIADIQKVRFKRHAAELGFIYGAGSGFIVGGIAGVVIDVSSGTSSNNDGAFTVGGIIGAIPGGLVGIVIGSAFTRGVFKLNGNKEKAIKLGKILNRRQKTLATKDDIFLY